MIAATVQVEPLALLSLVLSVISLVVTIGNAVRIFDQVRYNKRLDLSVAMVAEFFSHEFTTVRRDAWRLRQVWAVDIEARVPNAKYFCVDDFNSHDRKLLQPNKNGLLPLQSVSRVMAFWHRLVILHEAGLIEPPVVRCLQTQYAQWAGFMRELSEQCIELTTHHPSKNELAQQWRRVCVTLDALDWSKSVCSDMYTTP